MPDYKFTQDWFSWAPPLWSQITPLLPTDAPRNFLEIGSFEGRSAVWTIENMMTPDDDIYCIDTWSGGEEHSNGEMDGAEARFDHNMAIALEKHGVEAVKCKGTSVQHLAHWLIEKPEDHPTFDFIYIDGSHIARDVLTDACMAWPLLKQGGFMVFDDYMWGEPRDILHRPKPAIDAFVNLFAEEVGIEHMGYQLIVRKK
jgi:predicted O-methyltransferase YrrM